MFTLKKSLGQHFLKDEQVCLRIVGLLQQRPFTRLLEVGPGGGALTKYLLELPGIAFKAVELDQEKIAYLQHQYPGLGGKLIHRSFLDMDMPFEGAFTVIGNFPYNISSQILFRMIEWRDQVECMIGMLQKEVALRVTAKEGSKIYGVTSVLIQAYFDAEYVFEIGPEAFQPPPKVESAVIRLVPAKDPVKTRSEKHLFTLVKAAFNQRRKTLRNAVRGLFAPEIIKEEIFNKRAEQLTVAEFGALTFRMN